MWLKTLSDKEILEQGLDSLKSKLFMDFEEAFNPKNFPWLSRWRVKKLLNWIESHEIESFLYFAIGEVPEFDLYFYKIRWIMHLLEEMENE